MGMISEEAEQRRSGLAHEWAASVPNMGPIRRQLVETLGDAERSEASLILKSDDMLLS